MSEPGGCFFQDFSFLTQPLILFAQPGYLNLIVAAPFFLIFTLIISGLFDPLTNEEISRVYDIVTEDDIAADPELTEKDEGKKKMDDFGNEKFKERDYWFRIKAKFLWKESPKSESSSAAGAGDKRGSKKR